MIEYPEENEEKLNKLLDSKTMKTITSKINTKIGEITLPYAGADDDYIGDIINLLIHHDGNDELIAFLSTNDLHIKPLIVEFERLRQIIKIKTPEAS